MSDPEPHLPDSGIPLIFVVVFYVLLAIMGWFLLWLFGDSGDIWYWHDRYALDPWVDGAIGVGVGFAIVLLSQWLEDRAAWARALTAEFKKILGEPSVRSALVLAVMSSFGEELFFRGFVQRLITDLLGAGTLAVVVGILSSSLIFGMLHTGPDKRTFLPWTLMACAIGVLFGAMFWFTGNIFAPMLAHFTINFFSLMMMSSTRS